MSTINVHSIALERSILKELMMSGNSAVEQATSVLGTYLEHFYDDNRRNIYKTILDLYEENRNITSMIVFEKLKSSGKYNSLYREEFSRINSSRISGDLIECCSMLLDYSNKRRIGDILASVVQKATAENITYHHLIDEITAGVDSIANNSIITTADSIDNILTDTISHIKKVHKAYVNNEDLGINPGFKGLKNMIGCIEGNQLLVLAGRPAQGKTAFALSMAIEIAKQVPIAFFSLEMDKKQLMQRVISRENQVPLERIRKGNLTNDDKQAISDNTNIKNLNLIIDDNSDLDLNMLRNKIRKYQNDYGIKVVVIDYLQLMIAPNERSREQEVAKMTRTLKKLSKIYDIPIMMLAQLNRGVEQRGEGAIPQLSDLRECISMDTSILYSDFGISKTNGKDTHVLSISKDDKVRNNLGIYIPKEFNDVYRVKTKSGRYVDCTANHKLITTSGKKYVKDLTKLDSLCVPIGFINEDSREYISESRFIGWMLGNGSMVKTNSPSFITSCEVISNDFCEYIESIYGAKPKFHEHKKCSKVFQWDITFNKHRTKEGNPCTKWLRGNDLWGRHSYNKKIPSWFMKKANRQSICELMQGLIETDGCVMATNKRSKIRYSTTSEELANQIVYLLASIGIVTTMHTYTKATYRMIYNIDIEDTEMLRRFVSMVNIRGYRGEKVKELKLEARLSYSNNKINRDTCEQIKERLSGLKTTHRIQLHGDRRLTVENAKKVINEHSELLQNFKWIINEQYYWDAISSIEHIGVKDVFDLSVPGDNNFIVNGILSSNSGAIEQDADVVMFVHQGNIHVAKQRQGATGVVPLSYDKTFTGFWDTDVAGMNCL